LQASIPIAVSLTAIDAALRGIEAARPDIDAELQRHGIGRKDTFTSTLRTRMLCAYRYLDELVARQVNPFSEPGKAGMLELNNRVHYGTDAALRASSPGRSCSRSTNAVAYVAPSAEVKRLADRSTWRGRVRLPEYRKVFCELWQQHIDEKCVLLNAAASG
jgi:hypothetical protein